MFLDGAQDFTVVPLEHAVRIVNIVIVVYDYYYYYIHVTWAVPYLKKVHRHHGCISNKCTKGQF